MARKPVKTSPRKPRADAQRNRERILEVAKKAFAKTGVNVSMVSYHFDSKEGLFRTCLERYGRARLAATERTLVPAKSALMRSRMDICSFRA